MAKAILYMSMSLDGFITGPNSRLEHGLGDGGEILHAWFMGDENDVNRKFLADAIANSGAVIVGRTTYDQSVRWWGAHGPTGSARRTPVFVVTHKVPSESPENSVYTFVTEGIEKALEQAKAAAGDKDVTMSGANIAQQYLKAGLLDEIQLHLVPVLLGGGKRLFEHLGGEEIKLEPVQVLDTPSVTHLRYRVVKGKR